MAAPREILDLLDGAATAALTPLLAPRLRGWDAESWIRDHWVAGLDSLPGSRRWVVSETRVSSTLTRFHLEGERGTAVATIILDDGGRWFGASLKRRATEGIANIVLQCPWNEDREAMSALYGDLLHLDRWDVPQLVFDEGRPDDPRPRWPDPAHPQQMHLDIRVGDLDAVDQLVVGRGATRLADFDDHRVYADIVGHPFCLHLADVPKPELWRLVIDAADPDGLQEFYERLGHRPRRADLFRGPSAPTTRRRLAGHWVLGATGREATTSGRGCPRRSARCRRCAGRGRR